jgi:hypothetical protein
MMESVLIIILRQIVVPELAKFIQDHYNKTGKIPTKEEMETEVMKLADNIIMEGNAFLQRLRNENPQLRTD